MKRSEKTPTMRTDDLIRTLAADPPVRRLPMPAWLAAATLAGLAAAVAFYAAALGPRADIAEAAQTLRFLFKPALALALAALAAFAVLRLARPGAPSRHALVALLAVPALAAAAASVELLVLPRQDWAAALIGDNTIKCLILIPLLALAPLAALLMALRRGAPTRPALAGAAAGLLAGGLGAALYATHCTDDSPLFVAAWYSIAIAATAALGALAGGRLLRW